MNANDYINFPNPPITEALIDIRVENAKDMDVSVFEKYHDFVKERFPEKQNKIAFETKIQIAESKLTTDAVPPKQLGYLFKSNKENKVVQSKIDGFTFNKLKPYESWEKFKAEAVELWNKYYDLYKPSKINRIALRYINQIEIPLPIKDFNDYIVTVPSIPEGLPQGLASYILRLEIPNPGINAVAIMSQTFKIPSANKLLFLIDIDTFIQTSYSENKAEIWELFEKLRNYKNEIFFKNITNKTMELFK